MLATACGGGSTGPKATSTPVATPTPRPIPTPVAYAPEPAGNVTRGDPAFEALSGAKAYYGQLGGSIYQIEMPDHWNGRLVLYVHGSRLLEPTLWVDTPGIRNYLIRNGFAWGASSFSNNIPNLSGLTADETAALWDRFVQQFGRPQRTYVTGQSMGGGGAAISAERYPDRYDGALGLCGIAGFSSHAGRWGDFFVAGAFAAGVTQADFDSPESGQLIDTRILPALRDATVRERFEDIVIDLTGGPRPFDREGFLADNNLWSSTQGIMGAGLFDNGEAVYRLGPLSSISSQEFNAAAVRVSPGPLLAVLGQGNDTTGDIQIPLLTLHTTGDMRVPMTEPQLLQRRVVAAGKGDRLVQRAVQDARHCGVTNAEWERGLEDLISWVEEGRKPDGEDLLGDLSDAGREFTLAARFGSPEADEAPGADERVTVRGTITLDGDPMAGEVYIVAVKDGLRRYCSMSRVGARADGRYEVTAASDGEARGCGQPGAQLYVDAFVPSRGRSYWSQHLIDWPKDGTELTFDATLTEPGAYRPNTLFRGEVIDASGESFPVGTVIEAYIGDTLCGVTSLSPTVMALGDPQTYYLAVVGPESKSGCAGGQPVTFRVNGQRVAQTGVNDFDGRFQGRHLLDLVAQ